MPPAAPQERKDLERRPRRGLPGKLVVWDAELLGDGTAVTAMPVEQLHNAGRLAELTRAPQRALVGYRIDHPDAPVRRDGVRRPLHEAWLGRDPPEREAELIDEANAAHATDGTLAATSPHPQRQSVRCKAGWARGRGGPAPGRPHWTAIGRSVRAAACEPPPVEGELNSDGAVRVHSAFAAEDPQAGEDRRLLRELRWACGVELCSDDRAHRAAFSKDCAVPGKAGDLLIREVAPRLADERRVDYRVEQQVSPGWLNVASAGTEVPGRELQTLEGGRRLGCRT